MDINKKLTIRRKALGLTLDDVAKIVGVGKSTVLKWEKGDIANMKRDKIALLAKALQVSPAYIMGMDEYSNEFLINNALPLSQMRKIPILGTINAGIPILADENIIGYTYIPNDDEYTYFALKVSGDSMNAAQINNSNTVIIRKQDWIENGDIAVVLVDGLCATIKRVYYTDSTITLMPQSTNPEHKPQVFSKDDGVVILGKVVKVEIDIL